MLANMNDADLVALFKSLDPLTVPRYLKDGPNGYSSYEFTLLRRERSRAGFMRDGSRTVHTPARKFSTTKPLAATKCTVTWAAC